MSRIQIAIVALSFALLSNDAIAKKSVFIISRHVAPSQAQAYSIDSNQVTLQADVNISTYNQGFGAVGNAVWPILNKVTWLVDSKAAKFL